jgi:hypothetical protein
MNAALNMLQRTQAFILAGGQGQAFCEARAGSTNGTQIFTVNIGWDTFVMTLFVVVPTKCFSTGP